MTLVRADALRMPLADESVDCIVTSPPYFALRDYQDGDVSVADQIGLEEHPWQFLDALEAWTVECLRVMKPSASLFVNLGDKRSGSGGHNNSNLSVTPLDGNNSRRQAPTRYRQSAIADQYGAPVMKTSLLGLPWRYALRCVDQLGMGLVAEIIWAKRSAMPESVTRRVHGRHEHLFHLVKSPAFFAAGDEIREPHTGGTHARRNDGELAPKAAAEIAAGIRNEGGRYGDTTFNPLGRMPGSFWLVDDDPSEGPVWELSAEPFKAPPGYGDHFAAFPSEIPRRCILGWTTSGYCTACNEPRRPVTHAERIGHTDSAIWPRDKKRQSTGRRHDERTARAALGYACACPNTSAPTRPAVVLDPFVGTGTTVMTAEALGRTGIGLDLSTAFLRIADWRTTHPDQRSRVRTRSNQDAQGMLL